MVILHIGVLLYHPKIPNEISTGNYQTFEFRSPTEANLAAPLWVRLFFFPLYIITVNISMSRRLQGCVGLDLLNSRVK